MRCSLLFHLALAILPITFNAPLMAQGLPAAIDGSRIEKRFETPPEPTSQPGPLLPPSEQAPPPEKAASIRFSLSAVSVDGNSVFAEADLAPLWQPLLGKDVSLAQIFELRDAVTAKYRNAGYVLSQAVVPEQRIRGGAVRLQVVEGFISAVAFQGEVKDRLGLLQAMADKIQASKPLQLDIMERYVMLADDLPGVALRTVLEADKDVPGGSKLTLVVEPEPDPVSLSVDNRGTHTVGVLQATASASYTGALGLFDRLTVQSIGTQQLSELRYLDISDVIPVSAEGTTLTLGARRSWSQPGYNLKPLEIDSLTSTLRASVSHPFLRGRSQTLRGDLSFTYRNSTTNILQAPQSEDRLRVLSAGFSYDVSDNWQGSNLFQLTAHKGLNILDASKTGDPLATRPRGHGDFHKFNATVQRTQTVDEKFTIVIAADGQFSPVELLSSEEFGVGGKTYGRAFDSSEITGDSGAQAKLELQHLLPPWPRDVVDYAQGYVFSDIGAVWDRADGHVTRLAAASYGVGLRFGLLQKLDASVELARPMIRPPTATGNRDIRAFFSLAVRY